MSQGLTASEKTLEDVFCDKFDFIVPFYQRPYAWKEAQALELFEDLWGYFRETADASDAEPYFLGSIVLIQADASSTAEIVDGQQRLTTLTILLAALRDQASDADVKSSLDALCNRPANKLKKIPPRPRLKLREVDQPFFEKFVQRADGFAALDDVAPEELEELDSRKNVWRNAQTLRAAVRNALRSDEAVQEFSAFLLTRCVFAVVKTPSQESAFRVFNVLNNRGLPLLLSDVLKAEIVGKIQNAEYAKAWEKLERSLGRKAFNELFGHILKIYRYDNPKTSQLNAFKGSVLTNYRTPEKLKAFFDGVLTPCAENVKRLRDLELKFPKGDKTKTATNRVLRFLNQIEFSDWLPPALAFLLERRRGAFAELSLLEFFEKLERLSAALYFIGTLATRRFERFAVVVRAVNSGEIGDLRDALELRPEEKRAFYERLTGDVYVDLSSKKRKYLVLRLDSFLAEQGVEYDWETATLEHVLPQTATGDYWTSRWSEDERERWTHRLANLVPLSQRRNSKASNADFKTKRDAYFLADKKSSPYLLTTQLLNVDDWTPEIVARRQAELLAVLDENWTLDGGAPVALALSESVQGAPIERLEFWTRFKRKLAAINDFPTQAPRSYGAFEIRIGKSGINLSLRYAPTEGQVDLRIYLGAPKIPLYLPTLEERADDLQALAGETPINWNANWNPNGIDRVILLKSFDFDPTNAADVDRVLDALIDASLRFRAYLRQAFAEDAAAENDACSLEELDYYVDCRELFDDFRAELVRRFPAIKQVVRKRYVVFKAQNSVVNVEFQKQGLRLHVNLTFPEVVDPDGVCVDLTGKGHWGSGDVGVYIRSRADVAKALRVVEQSYRKNA